MFVVGSLRLNIATLSLSMGWQTIQNVNITADIRFQSTIYIRMLFGYFKIVASSPEWLTINNTEKSVTVNIDKTTNDAKYDKMQNIILYQRRLFSFQRILITTQRSFAEVSFPVTTSWTNRSSLIASSLCF